MNIIRLNKQKLEKLRQDYGENSETYKGFHHMFWAFSKTPLTQTLTKIATPEVEQQALQISLAILTYAGLNPNGKYDSHVSELNLWIILLVQWKWKSDFAWSLSLSVFLYFKYVG